MANDEPYHTLSLSTARELLDILSPLNPCWDRGTFIFRGQGDSSYSLVPSACRRGPGSIAHGSARKAFSTTPAAQALFEIDLLRHFLAGCDIAGLAVPGYSTTAKLYLLNLDSAYDKSGVGWPDQFWYEPLATAQHYGVPTRLLDWSKRSFVAAYFAASSANFQAKYDSEIAIWALDISDSKQWKTINLVEPPGSTSKNQAAQSGIFTLQHIPDMPNTSSEIYQELGVEALTELYDVASTNNKDTPLFKFTLPITEAPALLDLLAKFAVTGSVLFPGYEGVAKSVSDWAKQLIGVRITDE